MNAIDSVATLGARKIPSPREIAPWQAPVSDDQVSLKTWIAVIGAALGAFLAVLNIQVVNSSLADIQGAIGAGLDTGGWISTSYLIAEIIVIPLAGWFSRAFSVRNYLIASAVAFLVFSVGCAQAHTLSQMIALRALQGFSGGVLIPLAFTLILTLLPAKKQPIGIALFAFSATFAPAVGPTIGGWLNDTYGWQYIFYVNLVPGALMLAMLWGSLERAPMRLGELAKGDWAGIITMGVGLAALETVLEEGNQHDWFSTGWILQLSIIAAIALSLFIFIELRSDNPLVNLRLLGKRNFGLGNFVTVLLGSLLYGTIYLLPVYLTELQGYDATQIGLVVAWTGLPQLVIIPFIPRLMRWMDIRLIVAAGFGLFAVSNFMNVGLTPDTAGPQLFLPDVVRAIGQAFVLTPLLTISNSGVGPENAATASALFNMLRNLGGAIGIAAFQTFLTKREQFHSNTLTPDVSKFGEATRLRIDGLSKYFMEHGTPDQHQAWHKAVIAIGGTIKRQATFMSFSDVFMLLGVISVAAVFITLFLKGTEPGAVSAGH